MTRDDDLDGSVSRLDEEGRTLMRDVELEAARGSWLPEPAPRARDTDQDRARRRAELARNWIGGDP